MMTWSPSSDFVPSFLTRTSTCPLGTCTRRTIQKYARDTKPAARNPQDQCDRNARGREQQEVGKRIDDQWNQSSPCPQASGTGGAGAIISICGVWKVIKFP